MELKLTRLNDALTLTPYIIYAQIGFSTNRQTFNKNIASAEKSPIFTSHKSLYEHVVQHSEIIKMKKIFGTF